MFFIISVLTVLSVNSAIYLKSEYGENGTLEFDKNDEFYKKYKNEIKSGRMTCMDSQPVETLEGATVKFHGIEWPSQYSGGKLVDYEKCIYIFTGAKPLTHSDANRSCKDKLISPNGGSCTSKLILYSDSRYS